MAGRVGAASRTACEVSARTTRARSVPEAERLAEGGSGPAMACEDQSTPGVEAGLVVQRRTDDQVGIAVRVDITSSGHRASEGIGAGSAVVRMEHVPATTRDQEGALGRVLLPQWLVRMTIGRSNKR